ncbi:MAG TPA: thioredoxin domain-containing protein [Steroidobacteraceae bacterium]|nr:thioredoxin domain-containing protein [Steroidobacteraceae bacterium]
MNPSSSDTQNRLANETSPYLLQHANNPVHWYPWCEEALERAAREDKPILLSIGYSACHWCHVMAHESFEDEATAALMNELFINIKVDREERPDLDKIFQLAHQMLTRRGGGWSLTMFLSPADRRPFFGGTYFPKEPRFGMPSFADLLRRVSEFYRTHREEIQQQNAALQQAFDELVPEPASAEASLNHEPLDSARELLQEQFDSQFGGFGGAPKFPHPTNLEFLLRRWRASASTQAPDLNALLMTTLTLTRMAEGGIYDQLGGGFARYSVDQYWMIPHFEKMLYDNGQLLRIYAHAALATGEPLYRRIAGETADWMLREMRSAEGTFWSALDADSEGHEGKFYVWDANELRQALSLQQYEIFARRFGLDQPPNFEGHWHLHVFKSVEEIATEVGLPAADVESELNAARASLLRIRNQRVRPGLDDKTLTSWNALAISALATAARTLRRRDFAEGALVALDVLRTELWRDGRLLATYKNGSARYAAYLDDYAFLIDAVLECLQTHWRSEDLLFAIKLADDLLERFEDKNGGGFYFTASDHEPLMHRSKSFADDAMPSGNGIAAQALHRLGLLLGEMRYVDAATRVLQAGWNSVTQYPHGHCAMLIALAEQLDPVEIVIVRGAADQAERWADELAKVYAPHRLTFAIPDDALDLPPAFAEKSGSSNEVTAYLCRGMTCSPPVKSLTALLALSGQRASA